MHIGFSFLGFLSPEDTSQGYMRVTSRSSFAVTFSSEYQLPGSVIRIAEASLQHIWATLNGLKALLLRLYLSLSLLNIEGLM